MLIRWFWYCIVVMLGVTIGRSWVKDTGDLFVLFLLLSVSPSIIISKEKLSSTHFYSTESYLTTRFPSISNWFGLLALHIISTLYRACFPMICAIALSIHVYLHMYCIYLHMFYILWLNNTGCIILSYPVARSYVSILWLPSKAVSSLCLYLMALHGWCMVSTR